MNAFTIAAVACVGVFATPLIPVPAAAAAAPLPQVPLADPNEPPPASTGKPAVERKLDGMFDDWSVLDPVATRRDETNDAAHGAADLVTLSLASDQRSFWIALEFASEVTLQGLNQPLTLFIDADSPKVGAASGPLPGADFAIIFSPTDRERGSDRSKQPGNRRAKSYGEGVVVRTLNAQGHYDATIPAAELGLGMAPSHASRFFEIRLDRTDARFADLTGSVRAASLVPFPIDEKDESKGLRVETGEDTSVVRSLLVPRLREPSAKAEATAVAKSAPAALRVVSWNAELGAPFKNPEPFATTLKALQPDVILWQELGKEPTAESLAAWMNQHVGGDGSPWTAVVSGGDLRTAVVARTPLAVAPFLDGLQRETDKGARDVRVAGALLDPDGAGPSGPILFASLHLKCCGRYASDEDRTREAEAKAIREAIVKATASLLASGTPLAGIVIGGDFNLVGTREILDRVGDGLDRDGGPLDVALPYQLDGLTNSTWRSTGNEFLPGRLDWILTSGASLTTVKSFVFSTEDLSPAAIATLGLSKDALKEPSDHQPVVVDLLPQAPVQRP